LSILPLPRIAAALLTAVLALAGCATLPPPPERTPTTSFTDTGRTRIGRVVEAQALAHPGRSGVRALPDGREAFVARYALAEGADRSIDVQTYIWRNDTSGNLLAQALWNAAERGVRVRVLLDDANTGGMDAGIAALDAHPNIEVRLFNPFANRSWRLGDMAADFSRVNRRMHNKSFTVDGQATVVGGRNIGNEYMGAQSPVAFADLDVLAAGPIAREVDRDFDRYWNSASAWPARALLPPAADTVHADTRSHWQEQRARPAAAAYLEAVGQLRLLTQLLDGTLRYDWVPARVISDDPAKVVLPPERRDAHMGPELSATFGNAQRELVLVSPYFVPGAEGAAMLAAMARRGVQVKLLTNSLAATDVGAVYSGYVHYRHELLRAGVRLFELKPAAMPGRPADDEEGERQRRSVGGSQGGGSSSASLHAKTFAVDRSRIFVGSFNLDPRSSRLNTEMGLVLESPALAGQLSDAFEGTIPRNAYELRLEGEQVVWIERTDAGEVRHTSTPGVGALRSLWIAFLSVLPIEWLL
jgi:cardiolipin synthase C